MLALLMPLTTVADPQSKSFSHWRLQDGKVSAIFTVATREVTRLTEPGGNLPGAWLDHLLQTVHLSTVAPCALIAGSALPSGPGYARGRLEWTCPPPVERIHIEINSLFGQVASHVHFANYHLPDGLRREQLFSQSARSQVLQVAAVEAGATDIGPILPTYVKFGFEHILIGLDHIAFLLCLLLLPGTWRATLWIVTGFTLGHSITLSLSALGIVTPDIDFIEALIGLSIALVAVENVACHNGSNRRAAHIVGAALLLLAVMDFFWLAQLPTAAMLGLALFCWCFLQASDTPNRARQLRPLVTGLFGLVHGFGFANVLLEVGLPSTSRTLALLGFNIGVELGQLAIVACIILAGVVARRIFRHGATLATDLLSAALCGLGMYWFVQRLYF